MPGDTVKLIIDDREIETQKGKSVLEAALEGGIYIPHLCYHPDLKPAGACGLCLVEIEGHDGNMRSCTTPAEQGMVVKTKTDRVMETRLLTIELLLARHPADCTTCPRYLNCELQSVKQYIGGSEELRVRRRPKAIAENNLNPIFVHDFQRCILCGRCVRACHELRGVGVLSFVQKGKETHIGTAFDRPLTDADCRFCGACAAVCPTGSIREKEEVTKGKSKREAILPCKFGCPLEVDVPCYVRLVAEGKYDESYAVVRESLPLPSICSYVCLSFCENECRHGYINEPIAIRELKRFVSERHGDLWKKEIKTPEPTGKKAAILGSGPAGLTAAYYLARKGHSVTVFEQASLPGGMLRSAISRKRLPGEALDDDIKEILAMGVDLKLNWSYTSIDGLFSEGFNAVLLATGSTFVGPSARSFKEEGIDITPQGTIQVESYNMATSREGVFVAGDATLGGISQDFINNEKAEGSWEFFEIMIDGFVADRGDSFRSATIAIASGKKAAEAMDQYLGRDGDLTESLLPSEEPQSPYLGREEGFAGRTRHAAHFKSPAPQYAALEPVEQSLDRDDAAVEAKRCLRCDLRTKITPIKFWGDF
jgi:formate hydrogenlyase subunit 6/NADH:ubiquinone oxidoreductase subunit I/ferredoxin